jgi:NAD-dependent dihydropyrimidine dehydrogenase PreA subunit
VVENSASPKVTATPSQDLAASLSPLPSAGTDLDLVFRPDLLVWDGRYANNPWLLEMPRPFTRLTCDNAALIAPSTADRLGINTEDVLTIAANGHSIEAPFFVLPGQAPDCITLPLGFGRRAGGLGVDVGFDAYRLRNQDTAWLIDNVVLSKTGRSLRLATTQGHDRVAGRDLIHEGTLADYQKNPKFIEQQHNEESLYPSYSYPRYAWAMAIDLNSCIGCQACAVACEAENNVPIVGKDQVLAGRPSHVLVAH